MPLGSRKGLTIDLHNDYHAVNLDSRQYLYPKNDYLQSNKDNDQHITSFTFFLFSPGTYMHTSTTVPRLFSISANWRQK